MSADFSKGTRQGLALLTAVMRSFELDVEAGVIDDLAPDTIDLINAMPGLGTESWDPHGASAAIFGLVSEGLRAAGIGVPAQLLSMVQPLVGLLMAEIYQFALVADGGIVVVADMT